MKESLYWFIKQSLILDSKFLKVSKWSVRKKIEFLYKKYFLIILHFLFKFKPGKSSITLNGKKIYYDSKFGLAGYQSLLSRHQKLLKLGKVIRPQIIIDIGANVGFFTMLCHELYPKSQILSIEPIPEIFNILKKNLEGETGVRAINVAVSEKNGFVRMAYDEQDSAISKVTEKGNIKIMTITLDELVTEEKLKKIDVLKIDTEGFEQNVLMGAQKALERTKFLFIEVTIKENKLYTISSLFSHLFKPGKFDFQLIAFRNFADTGEGYAPVLDCLLENKLFSK